MQFSDNSIYYDDDRGIISVFGTCTTHTCLFFLVVWDCDSFFLVVPCSDASEFSIHGAKNHVRAILLWCVRVVVAAVTIAVCPFRSFPPCSSSMRVVVNTGSWSDDFFWRFGWGGGGGGSLLIVSL